MAAADSDGGGTNRWLRHYGAGETLFKEGDRDRTVYVLIAGKVEISRDGVRIAEIGVADSFIGEVAALTDKPRWATARAMAPSTLLVVGRVEDLFQADPSWGLKLSRVLAERLDRMNERFNRLCELLELSRKGEADQQLESSLEIEIARSRRDSHY